MKAINVGVQMVLSSDVIMVKNCVSRSLQTAVIAKSYAGHDSFSWLNFWYGLNDVGVISAERIVMRCLNSRFSNTYL